MSDHFSVVPSRWIGAAAAAINLGYRSRQWLSTAKDEKHTIVKNGRAHNQTNSAQRMPIEIHSHPKKIHGCKDVRPPGAPRPATTVVGPPRPAPNGGGGGGAKPHAHEHAHASHSKK